MCDWSTDVCSSDLLLLASLARGSRFGVERLRNRRRAAPVRKLDDSDRPALGSLRDLEDVGSVDRLRRLDPFAVDVHAAAEHRRRREAPRLEEPRSPQPFVHAYLLHDETLDAAG